MSEIGSFLDTVSISLDVLTDINRSLRPTDTVLALYRINNSSVSWMDNCELESLAFAAETEYGIDIWNEPFCDWTLGELFRRLRAPNA